MQPKTDGQTGRRRVRRAVAAAVLVVVVIVAVAVSIILAFNMKMILAGGEATQFITHTHTQHTSLGHAHLAATLTPLACGRLHMSSVWRLHT